MNDNEIFSEQTAVPQRDFSSILSHAFNMYKGIFVYGILAYIVYLVISWTLQMLSGFDSNAFNQEIQQMSNGGTANITDVPGLFFYTSSSGILSLLISPIYVGLIYVTNKYNTNNPIQFSDLFIGYRQNLLNILLYSLISSILLGIAFTLCFLPVLFVAPFFLLGYSILLFENASAFDALKKSFSLGQENYGSFLGISLLGGIISLSGLLACCIGVIATAFFMLPLMYSTYIAYQGKPRPLIDKN